MRSDGNFFSATRRMLSARWATSGAKPSLTSVLNMSSVEQPRWMLCATQSCHSCGKSVRAIRNGQRKKLRVRAELPVGGKGQTGANTLGDNEGRHIGKADAGKCRRKATRQRHGRVGKGRGSGKPVRRGYVGAHGKWRP